jgi:hypothetical protein
LAPARSEIEIAYRRLNLWSDASETTEREIDVAVRDIVTKAFEQATAILRTRSADLDEGGRLLLARA